jgi:hypothetical protein
MKEVQQKPKRLGFSFYTTNEKPPECLAGGLLRLDQSSNQLLNSRTPAALMSRFLGRPPRRPFRLAAAILAALLDLPPSAPNGQAYRQTRAIGI